jgi:hypothetical protein
LWIPLSKVLNDTELSCIQVRILSGNCLRSSNFCHKFTNFLSSVTRDFITKGGHRFLGVQYRWMIGACASCSKKVQPSSNGENRGNIILKYSC